MFVGIDDTDSTAGMCTTYLAAKLCQRLEVKGIPKLVRLNPNIPYKTRGNAALSFETDDPAARETVLSYVRKYSMVADEKTNPGVAFLDSPTVPIQLKRFYLRAVSEHVTIEEADDVARETSVETHKIKSGRGIIGAMAAIGFYGDATYEMIAYRTKENIGKIRRIDQQSVKDMDKRLFPHSFDNLDPKGRRAIITPKGRDPIYCGIRGTSIKAVTEAWNMVVPLEPVECTQLFITNQATDAHLREKQISQLRPYDCVIVAGTVTQKPRKIAGGHTIFTLQDETGAIDCAAYKKSGQLREAAAKLEVGDRVLAYGGMGRHPKTINLEKLDVTRVQPQARPNPPLCCGKRMTSAGKDKGYKCKKCSKKISQKEVTSKSAGDRVVRLAAGLYDNQPGSRRHLSRPLFLKDTQLEMSD